MRGKSILRGVQISKGLFLLNGLGVMGMKLPACYTYCVDCGDALVLIDPGLRETWPRVLANRDRWQLGGLPLAACFLTHVHGDHLFAAEDAAAMGAIIYASSRGSDLINRDIVNGFREDPEYVRATVGTFPPLQPVADRQTLQIGNTDFFIYHTPGHSPGCMTICFSKDDTRYAAVGDLIFPDGSVGHVGARSFSLSKTLASLERLSGEPIDTVLGGHFYKTGRGETVIRHTLRRARELGEAL